MPPLQLRPRVVAACAARNGNLICRPNPRSFRSSSRTALVAVAAATSGGNKTTATATAADVVRAFYDGVNRRDLAAVAPLIAEECVYEDLVFPDPFVGREQIIGFFGEFMGTISPDLSAEDSSAVGVTWHLEWRGKPFPFSRGCSFYRLLESDLHLQQRQIV